MLNLLIMRWLLLRAGLTIKRIRPTWRTRADNSMSADPCITMRKQDEDDKETMDMHQSATSSSEPSGDDLPKENDNAMNEENDAQANTPAPHDGAADEVGTDPAADIGKLQETYEAQLAEMKDQLLRAVAETENVRRRSARDVEESSKYAVAGFARDLIAVSENLQLALQNIPAQGREQSELVRTLAEGVEMTLRELLSVFEKHGIRRVNPLGEKFDHNFHQAVSQIEDPTKPPGTVLQVFQAGYTLHDRLLRPAMVVVSKQGESEPRLDTKA